MNTTLFTEKLPKTQNPVFERSLLFLNTTISEKVKLQPVDFSSTVSLLYPIGAGPVLVVVYWPVR